MSQDSLPFGEDFYKNMEMFLTDHNYEPPPAIPQDEVRFPEYTSTWRTTNDLKVNHTPGVYSSAWYPPLAPGVLLPIEEWNERFPGKPRVWMEQSVLDEMDRKAALGTSSHPAVPLAKLPVTGVNYRESDDRCPSVINAVGEVRRYAIEPPVVLDVEPTCMDQMYARDHVVAEGNGLIPDALPLLGQRVAYLTDPHIGDHWTLEVPTWRSVLLPDSSILPTPRAPLLNNSMSEVWDGKGAFEAVVLGNVLFNPYVPRIMIEEFLNKALVYGGSVWVSPDPGGRLSLDLPLRVFDYDGGTAYSWVRPPLVLEFVPKWISRGFELVKYGGGWAKGVKGPPVPGTRISRERRVMHFHARRVNGYPNTLMWKSKPGLNYTHQIPLYPTVVTHLGVNDLAYIAAYERRGPKGVFLTLLSGPYSGQVYVQDVDIGLGEAVLVNLVRMHMVSPDDYDFSVVFVDSDCDYYDWNAREDRNFPFSLPRTIPLSPVAWYNCNPKDRGMRGFLTSVRRAPWGPLDLIESVTEALVEARRDIDHVPSYSYGPMTDLTVMAISFMRFSVNLGHRQLGRAVFRLLQGRRFDTSSIWRDAPKSVRRFWSEFVRMIPDVGTT